MNRVLHFTGRHRQFRQGAHSWEKTEYAERYHVAEEVGDTGYYINGYMHDHTSAYETKERTTFSVANERGESVGISAWVSMPSYSPHRGTMPAQVAMQGHLPTPQAADLMYACGECLKLASAYAEHLTQAYEEVWKERAEADRKAREERERKAAEMRAAYEAERAERLAARRAEQEKRQVFIAQRVEALQWYLDQPMRLRRRGKRSIVMGKLTDISERSGTVHILTERGDHWTTYADALEMFEIKYEGDRRYTQVELPDPPEGLELRVG